MSTKAATKRSLFAELVEGIEQMALHREGKITLRTHTVALPPAEETASAEFFVAAREKFNVSRAVWADMLRVSPRTVEKWEQGGQGSSLAATFVELVVRYPDTIERLQTLPRRVAKAHKTHAVRAVGKTAEGRKSKAVSASKPSSKAKAISA